MSLLPVNVIHWTVVEGKLEPLWFNGDALPQELINISQQYQHADAESDDLSDDDELPVIDTVFEDSGDE